MDRNYINRILKGKTLTSMQYKIIFTLMTGQFTKAQLAQEIGVSQQSINPVANELLELGLIYVSKTEGRNQYLACNSIEIVKENKKFERNLENANELYDEFTELSGEELRELEDDELKKYGEAILLICEQKLYTVDSLSNLDSYFSNLLNCEDDDITTSITNIQNSLECGSDGKVCTCWSYKIWKDCMVEYNINVEYTFLDKNITLNCINEHGEDNYYDIINSNVMITGVEFI